MALIPNLTMLPLPQRGLWPELASTPKMFTLYGGTALALRLGHRASVDFDFFSNAPFNPDELARSLPYLKVAVIQQRAEVKDYLDVDALLRHGLDLATALAAGAVVYGRSFNPLITLKALSYFDDVPMLANDVRQRLTAAVAGVDVTKLPVLRPYAKRPDDTRGTL
ncbi:MAG: nucleotidyl transferase AbiEii/AbiGii toxin family protein [Deltaproteobacteria bacterium]|nr:nucleotidyl transferase AbiEii/AbiGii toxin family protein [Deltaproteobacteria bacterium]